MMKLTRLILLVTLLFCVIACQTKKDDKKSESKTEITSPDPAHNSQNSLDWAGTYSGIIPCADCEGIKMTLVLNDDLTYLKTMDYLGTDVDVYTERGSFKWNKDGGKIRLYRNKNIIVGQYLVGENRLIKLTNDGLPITGEIGKKFTLTKP